MVILCDINDKFAGISVRKEFFHIKKHTKQDWNKSVLTDPESDPTIQLPFPRLSRQFYKIDCQTVFSRKEKEIVLFQSFPYLPDGVQ